MIQLLGYLVLFGAWALTFGAVGWVVGVQWHAIEWDAHSDQAIDLANGGN